PRGLAGGYAVQLPGWLGRVEQERYSVSEGEVMRRTTAAFAGPAACACAAMPAQAMAETNASMHPSFLPNRLGAATAFTLAFRFSGGEEGVPAPLSSLVVHLPAGLSIDLAGVGTCATSRLRSKGAAGCPPGSLIGRGHAVMKVHAGSQTVPEATTISVFRGPNRGSSPTFVIFGHGDTPLDQSTISTAVLQPDSPPYGSKLTISIPRIPTLMYEPDASVSSASVTVGNIKRPPRAHSAGIIVLPHRCPVGGFPFAAEITFADHSTTSASAQVPCP